MKIAIGCDDAAIQLKTTIQNEMVQQGHAIIDLGIQPGKPQPYPDIAVAVAEAVRSGKADRGALFCGTGIGMAISANKVPGIRAAVCHDSYSAERARKSNDAQIICMGARVIGIELAKQLFSIWLQSDFSGGTSADKVSRIDYYDRLYGRHAP